MVTSKLSRPRSALDPFSELTTSSLSPLQGNLPRDVINDVKDAVEAASLAAHPTQGAHAAYHHAQPAGGYSFFMPPVSYMGAGALTSAGAHIAGLGLKKALIVTDAVLKSCGAVSAVVDVLTLQGIESVIYDGVEPNPTVAQVEAGLAMLQAERCDCVVSFGGGSPHDAAKGIAAVATSGGSIRDYEGVDKLKTATLPLIAVNTTAGTASEMTRFAIITDVEVRMDGWANAAYSHALQ